MFQDLGKTYTVRLVDSVSYYITNPDGADPNSIYDFTIINITQPLQLSNTVTQNTSLDCYGDCDTKAVNVFGGTLHTPLALEEVLQQ